MNTARKILIRTRQAASVWLNGLPPAPPRASHGQMAVRDRFDDLRRLIGTDSRIIVDGGASVGRMSELFRSHYPAATIHAFEPIPDVAQKLQSKFAAQPQVVIHAEALGAEARTIPFQVLARPSSSSILTPSGVNRHYHPSQMDVQRVVEVPLVRLDEVLDTEIDLLKLDLQGYELEALRGAERLLARVKAITTEVEFVPLYEGQALFSDIDQFLRQRNFRLFNLYELFTQPDGQLTAGDAVYLNARCFDEV